jgi:hypothetical protein
MEIHARKKSYASTTLLDIYKVSLLVVVVVVASTPFVFTIVSFTSTLCGGNHFMGTRFILLLLDFTTCVFPVELHHSHHIRQFQWPPPAEIQFNVQ